MEEKTGMEFTPGITRIRSPLQGSKVPWVEALSQSTRCGRNRLFPDESIVP